MKVTELELSGVKLIESICHWDGRGMFEESFNEKVYYDHGLPIWWPQDNFVINKQRFTTRGLHMQTSSPQGKLVRCLKGAILDVAVDPRTGKHVKAILANPGQALYIPPGYLHGYQTMTPDALVYYKCTTLYDAKSDCGVRWNDPALDIMWANKNEPDIIISDKDRQLPLLKDFNAR